MTAFVCLFLIICFHFLFALQFLLLPYQFLCLFCIMHMLLFFSSATLNWHIDANNIGDVNKGPRKTGSKTKQRLLWAKHASEHPPLWSPLQLCSWQQEKTWVISISWLWMAINVNYRFLHLQFIDECIFIFVFVHLLCDLNRRGVWSWSKMRQTCGFYRRMRRN